MNEPEIKLTTLFAVEMLRWETPHNVAEAVIRTGSEIRRFFRRIEVLDVIVIGVKQFVRFRSDMEASEAILDHVVTRGRGVVISMGSAGFEARFPNRRGKVQGFAMYEAIRPGHQRMYRGPKLKNWGEQFAVQPQISLSVPPVQHHAPSRSRPVRAEVQG